MGLRNPRPDQRHLSAVAPTGTPGPDLMAERDALLLAAGHGDREAFHKLYSLVAPEVFGLVKRVLRNAAQAEEVAQDVLVEVWRTAVRFDPDRGSARSWILTLAHRRAVDRVRAEQSRRNTAEKVASFREAVPATPETLTVEHLDRHRVREAMGSLTPVQRRSIELAYFGGLTHTEIASQLDVPLGTVKTRIRDGLIRMRDALGVER